MWKVKELCFIVDEYCSRERVLILTDFAFYIRFILYEFCDGAAA